MEEMCLDKNIYKESESDLFIILRPLEVKASILSLCLVLKAFEQGGIFIVPHLL
jgi:hypothetical protein